MPLKDAWVTREGRGDSNVENARRRVNGIINQAFMKIDRALAAGKNDVAASEANFAAQDLDSVMTELSRRLLGGNS